jgi:hypothetical protein
MSNRAMAVKKIFAYKLAVIITAKIAKGCRGKPMADDGSSGNIHKN